MEWLLTAVLGAIPLYLFYLLITYKNNYWKRRGFPSAKSYPLIGSSLDLILKRRNFIENIDDIYDELKGEKYGGFMQFQNPTLMIRDPEMISQVLVKDFVSFHDRGFDFNEKVNPLSANVSALTGDSWRIMRYKMTPTFTSGKLKFMFGNIAKCSDDLIRFIKKSGELEARSLMQRFNLNVIGDVAFGLNANTLEHETADMNPFFEHSTKFFEPSFLQTMKFFMVMNFPKLSSFLKVQIISKQVHNFFTNLIRDTIEYREKKGEKRHDFLQLMLDLQKLEETEGFNHLIEKNDIKSVLEEQEGLEVEDHVLLNQLQDTPAVMKPVFTELAIAANSFMFLSGGSETTASALSFIIYELAANQDVQKRVQEEIDTVSSANGFDYAAVKKMTYLEQMINEVLRLHPPGGALMRVATKDYTLPGTDKVVEKGTLISIPVHAIHMNPEYFQDPEKFNPDRFEDMNNIPKGVFYPFGAGPRICIAMRFAMLEMKIVIAKLLMEFNIVLGEKIKLPIEMEKTSFTLHVVGGMWMKFVPRK